MASETGFLDLPREIREMIYDHVFDDLDLPSYGNFFTGGTVYMPSSVPLLYVHTHISEELQARLYKNHRTVIPIQEPSGYVRGGKTMDLNTDHMSRQRIFATKTIIVEVAETHDSYEVHDSGNEEPSQPETEEYFWEQHGDTCADMIKNTLSVVLSSFPNVKHVKLKLWDCQNGIYPSGWKEAISELHDKWKNINICIDLYLFDYYDQDAGDGGTNFVQGWHRDFKRMKGVTFRVFNFNKFFRRNGDEHYKGHRVNPEAWYMMNNGWMDKEEFNEVSQMYSVTVRPKYITGLSEDTEELFQVTEDIQSYWEVFS